MEWIVSEMGYIQSYLEDADAKQGGNRAVATFVTDIRVLGLDVEDIMDTYFPKIASPKKEGFFGRLRRAHGMLRERTEHEWKRLLENMGQEKDKCSKIFALSYKDLPTELKPCFLYFGIFPEDYEILAFDLINLWAAEGFIRGSDTQEVEEVGNDYLNHLFARNLIKVTRRKFDGRIKSLRIHDILHGLCVTEAKEINFFNTPNAATVGNSVTKVRRVTTNHECISSFNNYGTPKLRAMLFFNGEDWGVDNFPRDLRLLRVISLECQRVAFPLPSEIGKWSHVT
ncbi:hypothetical protein ACSBR2_038517 [Camellia fascicularis]